MVKEHNIFEDAPIWQHGLIVVKSARHVNALLVEGRDAVLCFQDGFSVQL